MTQEVKQDQAAQRMPAQVNSSIEIRVSLFEKGVQPIHFAANCFHNGLAIHGAGVEKYVEQRVVCEVS